MKVERGYLEVGLAGDWDLFRPSVWTAQVPSYEHCHNYNLWRTAKLYWECHQYASNVSKKSCQCPIHIQDSGTEDWISPPEELVARGWSFNVFNITNNLDEQTIAIYTFELQGHHHHILDRHELGPIFTFEGDLCQK